MSLGYCGRIELFAEDDSVVIYRYSGENWNDTSETRGDINVLDGEIIIFKRCLVEPEIHTKIKRASSRRKFELQKRVIRPVHLSAAFENGDIEVVKPCTSEYSLGAKKQIEQNFFATKLLHQVFTKYQETGVIPRECSFIM